MSSNTMSGNDRSLRNSHRAARYWSSWLATVLGLLLFATVDATVAAPVSGHPRLWLRADDLPRLRSWAVPGNPVYQNGLVPLVAQAVSDMDSGLVPGDDAANGGVTYVGYPAEQYAELFAFMSLISADQLARDNYAQRARTLLMYVINKAQPGAATDLPYRDPEFSVNDRSRWHGEGFALTVDWIYPYLSTADKTAIRQVFLRWCDENLHAAITGHDHPEPVGTVNDPSLTNNRTQVRWSLNNYWTAHLRNVGQMALALDAADDPGANLRGYLTNATGAWLYVFDYALRHDAQGGLLPEGMEYGPQTLGFAAQFLLALHTAGMDDPATLGTQVSIPGQPFWNDAVTAYLHSASPRQTPSADLGAPVYLPAWYGDGQHYFLPDYIEAFGPLALYDAATGNANRLNTLRWIQTHLPPGGQSDLANRANDGNFFHKGILYFMLFDPTAAPPTDPRPSLATENYSPGLGRVLARTDWSQDAAWFTYKLSWNQVDHQYGDGNQFEFYRRGEWLTKERTGYDLDYGAAQNHNTLALQNDAPEHNEACAFRNIEWLAGAQWNYASAGNPDLLAYSLASDRVYALGDATNLYNSDSEGSTDIVHASRSIVWLKPDHIVVYDRAVSKTANRFKRFWLNTPTRGTVNGTTTTVTTAGGQRLFVNTLLPAGAQITTDAYASVACPSDSNGFTATDEPMQFRLRVEAPGGPTSTRFLHVLQGADAGVAADAGSYLHSTSGTPFEGVLLKDTAILFPVDVPTQFTTTQLTVPATLNALLLTGLAANSGYAVTGQTIGSELRLTVTTGGTQPTDSGGVLTWSPAPIGAPGAPTLIRLIPGNGSMKLVFTPPTATGASAITGYTATCTPSAGGTAHRQTGATSPIQIGGLITGASYRCSVHASNDQGVGSESAWATKVARRLSPMSSVSVMLGD